MHQDARSHPGNIIRPKQFTTSEYMIGSSRKEPKRCLHCQKPFKRNESWQRRTAPADPKLGTYAVGIHSECLP